MKGIKRIFVVSGTANAGKSRALKLLAEKLLHISGARQVCGDVGWSSNVGDKNDYSLVIEIPHIGRVGICTAGDSANQIKEAFSFLINNECEIACVATRHESGHPSVKQLIDESMGIGVVPLHFELMYLYDNGICTRAQKQIVDAITKLMA